MKPVEEYVGREQTYLKHFALERYLERVAYNIGSFSSDFVYVDGFSGPWRSEDTEYGDTSFKIAIDQLRLVRDGWERRGRCLNIRCLFIEKSPDRYRELVAATKGVQDIKVETINGEFEDVVPEILQRIGGAFALTFVDPTGWKGLALKKIAPLLQHQPGEVVLNFMYDYINRFIADPSVDDLFGGPGWEALVDAGDREDAIVEFYCERIRAFGRFPYVTWTKILKPASDRTYFHLVYGTRHYKGLVEFRGVEEECFEEQERIRAQVKEGQRLEKTGQLGLFAAPELQQPSVLSNERQKRLHMAEERIRDTIRQKGRLQYQDLLGDILLIPLVWPKDVQAQVMALHRQGVVEVVGLRPRERVPKSGHEIIWKGT